jgi:transcriptional regulator with XRE-family HTH domain
MQMLPPKQGRNSRLGHISIEDFAALVGTTKQRVIDWRKGNAYPDSRNRVRLAEVSGGVYTPDDFKGPSLPARQAMADRMIVIEEAVADLTTALDVAQQANAEIRERVAALEAWRAALQEADPKTQSMRPERSGP